MTELDLLIALAETFILGELLVLIPVLYMLGIFLKRTPVLEDWLIPWIVVVAGVVFALVLAGLTPEAVIQGILIAGVTVLTNQLYTQTKNREAAAIEED